MKVLEILNEAAPEGRSFDIQELVKTFKNKAEIEKHVRKLWGTDKLTFKGQPFFKGNEDGPVIKNGEKAARKEFKNTLEVELEYKSVGNTVDITVDEAKMVYIGYSQSNDMLYFGYDVWLNGEELENEFDALYKDETGEDYDYDDPKLEKEWKKFRDQYGSMYGVIVEVRSDNGKSFDGDLLAADPGGFYKGVKRTNQFKSMNLIDLMNS